MGGVLKQKRDRGNEPLTGPETKQRNIERAWTEKKCRILARIWDPRIKGCCFVPQNEERCCSVTLQIGTMLHSIVVFLVAVGFQVYYLVPFSIMEYLYVQAETSIFGAPDNLFCGGASTSWGYDTCLGLYVARFVGDVAVMALCIPGLQSAPCEKINPNMLETRHCQATTFFIGLCVALGCHTFFMFWAFAWWGSGAPAQCFNETRDGIGAYAPYQDMFCESDPSVQAALTIAQLAFIVYLLYAMLITLSYRGWLIVLHMRHFKGFKGGDWSDVEDEDEGDKRGARNQAEDRAVLSAKVAPEPVKVEDDFQKALDDMLQDDHEPKATSTTEVRNPNDAWIEAEDEDGNTYYTNFITGESAWSLPTDHLKHVQAMFEDVIDQSEERNDDIETVYQRFRTGEGKDGLIDYTEFCKVLQVDANDQVKKLFDLFDEDCSGKLTVKEFVVGVCNFTGKDTAKKVEFAFKVFDEDNDGVINVEELCQILRAIHMAKDENEVQRKAKLIMAKSDTDQDGVMSFDEFVSISAKFPNILFPAFNLSNQLGLKLGFT